MDQDHLSDHQTLHSRASALSLESETIQFATEYLTPPPLSLQASYELKGDQEKEKDQSEAEMSQEPSQVNEAPFQLTAPVQLSAPVQLKEESSEEETVPETSEGDRIYDSPGEEPPDEDGDDSDTSGNVNKHHDDSKENILQEMGEIFGQDFSNVQIYQNSPNAKELQARAFTAGNSIYFNQGEYQPQTKEGRELLAHELTHVIQQRRGQVDADLEMNGFQVNTNENLEREADEAGAQVGAGERPPFSINSTGQNSDRSTSSINNDGGGFSIQRKIIQRDTNLQNARHHAERLHQWLSAPNLIHFSTIRTMFINRSELKPLIKSQYFEITGRSVEYDLKRIYSSGGNPTLDLVTFWPYLFRTSNAGLYNDIATFLLPTGAVENHLFSTLRRLGNSQESRQRLVNDYNQVYGSENPDTSIILGSGSLINDIRNDEGLGDLDKQKWASLVHHATKDAEKIFWYSGAISGTNNGAIMLILERIHSGGPRTINSLYVDWYNYVRSERGWSSGLGSTYKIGTWTDQDLNILLREEFAVGFSIDFEGDRDRRIVEAFINGFTEIRATSNQDNPQQNEIEEAQIRASERILNEAVNDLGTNETVVFNQLRSIRAIYERRLRRARQAGEENHREHREYWTHKRNHLWDLVCGDMLDGTADRRTAHSILFGNIDESTITADPSSTAVPQLRNTLEERINHQLQVGSVNWDQIEQQITTEYKLRRLNLVNFHEQVENEGAESFQLRLLRTGGDINFSRITYLTRIGQPEVVRGVMRLSYEFSTGNDTTSIDGVISFLTGMNSGLKQNILRRYAGSPDILVTGDQNNDLITFITNHYPETQKRYDLLDLVVPAQNVVEYLNRAESRINLEDTGEHIENQSIRYGRGDEFLIAHHHLERLRELARLNNATPAELDAVLQSYGQSDLNAIAASDYEIIVTQLRAIHANREQMKEYLVSALEIGVETALTVLTAGVSGGALLATLGSKMAGILARSIAFDDYEALSTNNLQDVAISIATLGTGQMTNRMISARFSEDMLRTMTRSERLMVELWREAQNEAINQSITNTVNRHVPTAEEIFQSAVSILGTAGGNTSSLRYRNGNVHQANSLREHVADSMTSNMVSSGITTTGQMISTAGVQNGSQIIGNATSGMGRAMLRGLNGGLSSFGSQRMEAHRTAQSNDETDQVFDLSPQELAERSNSQHEELNNYLDQGSQHAIREEHLAILENLGAVARSSDIADQFYEARRLLNSDTFNHEDLVRVRQLIEEIQNVSHQDHAEEAETNNLPLRRQGSDPEVNSEPAHSPESRADVYIAENRAALENYDRRALLGLLQTHGVWRDLIFHLQASDEHQIATYLNGLRNEIKRRLIHNFHGFVPGASTNPESDIDMSFGGNHAGQLLQEAEDFMRIRYGDNWTHLLRMNFYTDPARHGIMSQVSDNMDASELANHNQNVSDITQELSLAQMIQFSEGDSIMNDFTEAQLARLPEDRQQHIRDLAAQSPAERESFRIELHNQVDNLYTRFSDTQDSQEREDLARQISLLQTRLNYLTEEAYIGPGATRAVVDRQPTAGHGAYQHGISQIPMIMHIVHSEGGNLEAARTYEFWKYVGRYVDACHSAGIESASLTFFGNQSFHINRQHRQAHSEDAHNVTDIQTIDPHERNTGNLTPQNTVVLDQASGVPVTDDFLATQVSDFLQMVDETLPQLEERRNEQ